jgi:hypothetical protein
MSPFLSEFGPRVPHVPRNRMLHQIAASEIYLLGGVRCVLPLPQIQLYLTNHMSPSRQISPPVPPDYTEDDAVRNRDVARRPHRPVPHLPHPFPPPVEINAEQSSAASLAFLRHGATFLSSYGTPVTQRNGHGCAETCVCSFCMHFCIFPTYNHYPTALNPMDIIIKTHYIDAEPPSPIIPSLRGRYCAPRLNRCTFMLIM